MTSNSKSTEDIAGKLHEWMEKEMQFKPQGRFASRSSPNKEALMEICRGPMLDVWQYVTTHVKSTRTVQKIRGNLVLHFKIFTTDDDKSREKLRLYEWWQHLKAQRKMQIVEQTQLEKDLQRVRKEVMEAENLCRDRVESIREKNHQSALQHVLTEKMAEEIDKFNELNKRLRGKIVHQKSLKEKSGETVFFSRNEDDKLESACTKKVREVCESTQDFFHLLLHEKSDKDRSLMKNRLWSQVGDLMQNFPAIEVYGSIVLTAEETLIQLCEMTRKIDIKVDAEKLRFKYEVKDGASKPNLLDVSTPPSLLQSVHELIEEGQSQHITQFLKTQNSKNNATTLQVRLDKGKEQVNSILEQTMSSNSGALEFAKALFDLELEEMYLRTKVVEWTKAVGEIQEIINRSEKEQEILYSKQKEIEEFRSCADSKQNLITVLVKQNVDGKLRLEEQRAAIRRYVQNTLPSHEDEVTSQVQLLLDGVKTETDTFSKLALPYLVLIMVDSAEKMAIINLSINRLSGGKGTLTPYTKALDALEFPAFKAPECLLQRAIELKEEIGNLSISHERLEASVITKEQDRMVLAEKFEELQKKIEEYDSHINEKVLPHMKIKLKRANEALSHCIHVKDLVTAWWEQPGQIVAPWLKVDDQTLQQWKHKWNIAVSKIRLMETKMRKDGPSA